ncbi:MAG: hypothetical protein ACRDV3_09895, partial [Acidothermaceae bacterium]
MTESKTALKWHASDRQRRLFTLAALGLFAALATQRAILVVLAAPAIWLLLRPYVVGVRGGRDTSVLSVSSVATPDRCLEGELLEVNVRISTDRACDQLEVEFVPGETVELVTETSVLTFAPVGDAVEASWSIRAT